MSDVERFRRLYDEQLRTEAETPSQIDVVRLGPLRLVTFAGGRGFVTYRDLTGAGQIDVLIAQALEHYRSDPRIRSVRWKARAHDHAPGLAEALIQNGFVAGAAESIMVGEAAALAVGEPTPGVSVRRVVTEDDVRAMSAMSDEAFGDEPSDEMADALLRRLALNDGMQLWVAEAEGRMVGAGRLEPVPDSDFAGFWGGSVLKEWRGRGIYRALTRARARAALELGRTLIHSDSTEHSRPILERSGLLKVSSATAYVWER
ncbi:GNAT family N-acetyltransferase [Kineosporia babensis]|uniref:GNAT family N-acetyltransferase n=1 Tax=Kineosporia babensis TaxID=499548 RepID=A0A9X1NJ88_9ACTN|nr:GNAT family N-acetyltransferase [Kineosporia babensis]MCD5316072.1 GNAT family N-acetyltransferase [Kineosporia babensis]